MGIMNNRDRFCLLCRDRPAWLGGRCFECYLEEVEALRDAAEACLLLGVEVEARRLLSRATIRARAAQARAEDELREAEKKGVLR